MVLAGCIIHVLGSIMCRLLLFNNDLRIETVDVFLLSILYKYVNDRANLYVILFYSMNYKTCSRNATF